MIFQKYQDSTPIQNYSKIIQKCFENGLNLLCFTCVLRLSAIIQDLLRFHHRISPFLFKTLGHTNCSWTHRNFKMTSLTMFLKKMMSGSFRNFGHFWCLKCWDMKNNTVPRCSHNCFVFFEIFLHKKEVNRSIFNRLLVDV